MKRIIINMLSSSNNQHPDRVQIHEGLNVKAWPNLPYRIYSMYISAFPSV